MNIIEMERLEKSFDIGDSKVRILKDINLQIQKGDFVCIMGASGSGKTTLLQLLGGLDIPSLGSIRVDGTEISTLKEKELALFRRHKIGFIFQQFNLIPVFSAEENVGLPLLLDNVSQKKAVLTANRLLDLVGLKGKEKHLPAQLSGLELTVIIIPYNQVFILALASVILGSGAAMIASLQLRKFKLSDTLKELSA